LFPYITEKVNNVKLCFFFSTLILVY
jgi:hypothetical protein